MSGAKKTGITHSGTDAQTHHDGKTGSVPPGQFGEFSLLMALEPRFMFDAAVAAEVAEVADMADSHHDAGPDHADGGDDAAGEHGDSQYGPDRDEPGFSNRSLIAPMSSDYGQENEQPTINLPTTTVGGNEDTKFVIPDITVADPEGDTVQVTLSVENGSLFVTLPYDSGVEIILDKSTAAEGGGYTTITIEGEPGHLNSILAGLKYQGNQDFAGTDKLAISVIEKDPAQAAWHDPATATVDIVVNPVNDAPELIGEVDDNQVPKWKPSDGWSVQEDTPLSFGSGPDGSPFFIRDVDGDNLTVSFDVREGTLSFTGQDKDPVLFTDGNGTAWNRYTFTGTAEQINEIIAGMNYQGNQDFAGSDTMRVTVFDGTVSPSWDINIEVTAVDDDPVWDSTDDVAFKVDEGGSTLLDESHFHITDVDTDPEGIILRIESVPDPDKGVLQMKMGNQWITLGVGGTFSYQDVIDGRIQYLHNGSQVRGSLFPGSDADRMVFSIDNLRNAAGERVENGEISLAVELLPINQAPTLTVDPETGVPDASIVYEGEKNAVITFEITDPDQDPNTGHTVIVQSLPQDGTLYYHNGTNWVKVAVGMELDMNRVKDGKLVYHHNGDDGAAVGQPMGGTRDDHFSVTLKDDGGGAGDTSAITTAPLQIDIKVLPSNDLPVFDNPIPPSGVVGEKDVHDWQSDIVIDNSILGVSDIDSPPGSITYTLQAGDYKGKIYIRTWDPTGGEDGTGAYAYREITAGASFTQADVNAGRVVYTYYSGFNQGLNGENRYVHQGTDAFKFTVRDGSRSVVDADGYRVDGGFEAGVGKWEGGTVTEGELVDGVWVGNTREGGSFVFTDVIVNMNVDFTIGSGPGTIPERPIVGESTIKFEGDEEGTVYEGGEVTLTEDDLHASLEFPVTENGQTSMQTREDPNLTYRVTSEATNGVLRLYEYDVDADGNFVGWTGAYRDLVDHCSFTQQDVEMGAVRYVHNGDEVLTDSLTFSISDGTVEYTGVKYDVTVLPVNDTPSVSGSITVKEGPTDDQRGVEHGFDDMGVALPGQYVVDGEVVDIFRDVDGSGTQSGGYADRNDMTFVVVGKPAYGDVWIYKGSGDKNNIANWQKVVYATEADAKASPDWSGLSATVMTMDDIAQGNVRYIHDGSEQFVDAINIIVNDNKGIPHGGSTVTGDDGNGNVIEGEHGSSISEIGTITVEITPVNDKPIEDVNETLTVAFGDPARQTPDQLTAAERAANAIKPGTDPAGGRLSYDDFDNPPGQIVYRVTETPQSGKLYHFKDGRYIQAGVGSTFTQQDIIDGKVIYIHNGIENVSQHADSFKFMISDGDSTKPAYGEFNIAIEMQNVGPTITKTDPNNEYYVENETDTSSPKGTGFALGGKFAIGDIDYNCGPDQSSGISSDWMQVELVAKYGSAGWGSFDWSAAQSLKDAGRIDIKVDETGRLVMRGSKADLQAALDLVVFHAREKGQAYDRNYGDINDKVTITLTVNDLANGDKDTTLAAAKNADVDDPSLDLANAKDASISIIVAVSPENNPPTFGNTFLDSGSGKLSSLTTPEDTKVLVVDNNGAFLTVNDLDEFSRNVNEVTITVEHGSLSINPSGIRVTGNNTGTLVLRGTNAAINNALKSLYYVPAENYSGYDPAFPNAISDTVSITYHDGNDVDWGTGTNSKMTCEAHVDITITPVNDTPTVTAPVEPIMIAKDTPTVIKAGDVFVHIDDKNDLDGGGWNNGADFEVTIRTNEKGSTNPFGTVSIAGTGHGATIVSGNGTDTLVLKGTREQINAALESLTYEAPGTCPQNADAEIVIHVNDHGNGSISPDVDAKDASATISIVINDTNDAPEIVIADPAITVAEDSGKTLFDGLNTISINDPDAFQYPIIVELSVEHGALSFVGSKGSYGFTNKDTFEISADGKSVRLVGSQAKINRALAQLQYKPDANYNGADTLTIRSDDQGYSNVGATEVKTDTAVIHITVEARNDAPGLVSTGKVTMDPIPEDIDEAVNGGHTVGDLFADRFKDPTDNKQSAANPTGSESNAFIGVWVTSVTNDAAKGTWEYYDTGTGIWKTIQNDMFLRSDTAVRFQPVDDFNSQTDTGTAGAKDTVPDLKVRLVESTQAESAYAGTPDLDALCDIANGYIFTSADKTNADGFLKRDGANRYTNEILLGITVTAVNDGPEITYAGAGSSASAPIQVNEDSDLVFSGSNKIEFSDVDYNERTGGYVTVTLAVGHGSLTLGQTTGLDSVTGNGGNSITLTGSLDAINAAINGMKYRGDANYNGPDTLSVGISDNGFSSEVGGTSTPLSDTATIHIQVDAMNDAPTLTDTGKVTMDPVVEDVADAANAGQTVDDLFGGRFQDLLDNSTDSESNAFIGVWVTQGQTTADKAKGVWEYYDDSDADPDNHGWREIQKDMFLRKDAVIRFQPGLNFNTQTDSGTGGDKGAAPDLHVRLVESTQAGSNYGPGADLDILSDFATGHVFTAAELASGILTRDGAARYTDELALGITVKAVNDAPTITYEGGGKQSTTPISVDEDSNLVLNNANKISFADVDYDERTGGNVTVTLEVSDGTLTLGSNVASSLTVAGNGGKKITITGSIADINAAVDGLTYRGDPNYNGADIIKVNITDNGFSSEKGGTQQPLSAEEVCIHILVDAVNDKPTVDGPAAVTVREDNTFGFTGANSITVDDPDIADGSGEDALSVVLGVGHGTLSVDSAYAGLVTGNGSSSLTLAGTRQQINDALASLKYQPTENWYGNDSLTVVATDSAAGQKGVVETSDTQTVAITVTPINDAPVVDAGHTVVAMPDVTEDTPRDSIPGQTIGSLFGDSFCDPADALVNPADAHSLDGVLVVGANSTGGVWEYNTGSGWTAMPSNLSDSNGLYLKTGSQVRFVPGADYNGTAPTLQVRLVDTSNDTAVNPANTGAPANGATGIDVSGKIGGTTCYSADTVTLTQTVTAVNDSPVVKDAVGGVAVNDIGKINPGSNIVQNGETVADLFGDYYQDTKDGQYNAATNPNGSREDGFQGVLITEVIGSEYGEWYYTLNGGQETKLVLEPGKGLYLPKDAVLRFEPKIGADEDGHYFLTARLLDDSQPVAAGTLVPIPSTSDLTDAYSEGVVKIGSSILGENLAPEIVVPDSPTVTERDTTPIRLSPNGSIDDLNLNAIDWRNATLTIGRDGGASAVDVFSSVDTAVLGELREGSALTINGVTVGVVTKNSGGVLKLTFNDNAGKQQVNDVLQNIGYQYRSSENTTAVALRYTVNDGNEAENGRQGIGGPLEGSAVQTVVITPVDEDPIANTDRNHIDLSAERTGQASGNVLVNDHDPDGTAVNSVPQVIVGRYGSVVIDANGNYTYTINPTDVLGLNRGETWTETFRYEMHDGNGGAHQFADLVIDIRNDNADNFGSAVEPPPPVMPPVEPESPEPPPTPVLPPATPGGIPADPSTPTQNETNTDRDSSGQHISEIVDKINEVTATPPPYQDVVYDIDRLPWSEDIYLKSRPDSRNIYRHHTQEFTLPDTMFEHSRPGEELSYEAVMADGSPLPEWIVFDRAKKAFSCKPPEDMTGVFEVVVLARDSQNHFAKASLSIMVRPPEEVATANGFRDPDQLHRVDGEETSETGTTAEPEADVEKAEGDGDPIDDDTARLLEQILEEGATVEPSESEGVASDETFTGRVARVSNTGLWIRSLELVEAASEI